MATLRRMLSHRRSSGVPSDVKDSKKSDKDYGYCDGYDKEWAKKYILDPLTAPEPNQETGPGASHVIAYSATPRSHEHKYSSSSISPNSTPRRFSSIKERFPGDMSHRPLDMIKREAKAADRVHRHRKRISETDTIDQLDTIGGAYHHGGPYDATLTSRNLNKKYSPVAAVEESNMKALRATPRENVIDSLTKHVPLQGTATIPAGSTDMSGRVMAYEEGADLMREADAPGGAYKRWDSGVYHPDDLKGKGEPSFSIERDLKKGKGHAHHKSEPNGYEMRTMSRRRRASQSGEISSGNDAGLRRSHSTGKKLSEGLKRRIGSLRRRKSPEATA
ncbi:hypothetical protein QQS21_006631 [Conoideocrella luteorostrata]|uniref:Pal1 cell morphology n=1 Tax=Conoideocrella luteorostrata TaxID=1105319 RepID=A0AAJ0CM94_9HYPO|nr:hypothetical protein QQS21_006631 [Conoideocrella luteorostrata]